MKKIVIAVEPQGMGAEKAVAGIDGFLNIKSVLELRRAAIEGRVKVNALLGKDYITQEVYDLYHKYYNYCVSIEKPLARYMLNFQTPPQETINFFSPTDGRFMELKSIGVKDCGDYFVHYYSGNLK